MPGSSRHPPRRKPPSLGLRRGCPRHRAGATEGGAGATKGVIAAAAFLPQSGNSAAEMRVVFVLSYPATYSIARVEDWLAWDNRDRRMPALLA